MNGRTLKVCVNRETGGGRKGGHLTHFAFTGLPGIEIAGFEHRRLIVCGTNGTLELCPIEQRGVRNSMTRFKAV